MAGTKEKNCLNEITSHSAGMPKNLGQRLSHLFTNKNQVITNTGKIQNCASNPQQIKSHCRKAYVALN